MTTKSARKSSALLLLSFLTVFSVPAGLAAQRLDIDLNVAAAVPVSAQASLNETLSFDFLSGENPLIRGNNLKLVLGQTLTPVSVAASFDAVLTPVAFLKLGAGVSFGSGWDIGIANGLGVNERLGLHGNQVSTEPFIGLVTRVNFDAVFQFDTAVLVPGEWNHLQFSTHHQFSYQSLSGIDDDTSWVYQGDDGGNRRGWGYSGSYYLGYQMPIVLENIGLLVDTGLRLYQTPGREMWGDDLMNVNFGPVLNFRLSGQTTLALVTQFNTRLNFVGDTGSYGFYQDRIVDRANPYHLEFNRVALSLNTHVGDFGEL